MKVPYYIMCYKTILFQLNIISPTKIATCIFFCMYGGIIINLCKTRVKTWVKISKVMPQPKSISPGKGGKPYSNKSKSFVYNMVRLNRTYYSLFKSQAKFSKLSSPVKFQQITQIPRNLPTQSMNYAKFAHFVNLFYIMFQAPAPAENPAEFQRITQIPRNSPTQPANHTNSAHFALRFKYM